MPVGGQLTSVAATPALRSSWATLYPLGEPDALKGRHYEPTLLSWQSTSGTALGGAVLEAERHRRPVNARYRCSAGCSTNQVEILTALDGS